MIRTLKITVFILSLVVFTTCMDGNYDNNYNTFEEDTVSSFLEKNEVFSEFYKLASSVGITDLLNAYGTYTCFAPTNEAMKNYYEEKGTSFELLSPEQIREIVYNHLLPIKLPSIDFPEGIVSSINLDQRYLYITTKPVDNILYIYVNENSRIVLLDQKVHNGLIHGINALIKIAKKELPEFIQDDKRFSLFAEALFATGLSDSLLLIRESDYEQQQLQSMLGINVITPPTWRYAYTAFMESDSTYIENEIHSLDDLKTYASGVYDRMYPEDKNIADITNRRNSLNRFIAYHLMKGELAENEFVPATLQRFYTPGTIMYSYFMPMCPNALIEVQTGVLINKRKDGTSIKITSPNHAAENGVFHEIDQILVYDENMESDVLNKRIRIDAVDLFHEMTSNKIRNATFDLYVFPRNYLTNVSFTEQTEVQYRFYTSAINYRGDEIILCGKYDFTVTMPPIPAGTYEIRLGYAATTARGVAQIYLDGQPCGIPLDMRILGIDPKIGWENDNDTDDKGIQNDKMMHNRGYMKAPETAFCEDFRSVMRNNSINLRLILSTKTFDKTQTHTLRVKTVMEVTNLEFKIDYLEFTPISYLEREGRD
jgi:uncharacterized surface protein with fasciclin (FAS1) repeats